MWLLFRVLIPEPRVIFRVFTLFFSLSLSVLSPTFRFYHFFRLWGGRGVSSIFVFALLICFNSYTFYKGECRTFFWRVFLFYVSFSSFTEVFFYTVSKELIISVHKLFFFNWILKTISMHCNSLYVLWIKKCCECVFNLYIFFSNFAFT